MSTSHSVRFSCPSCGASMKALVSQAGQSCNCPKCHAPATVPGAAQGAGASPASSSSHQTPGNAAPPSGTPAPANGSPRESSGAAPARPARERLAQDPPPETAPPRPKKAAAELFVRCPLCRAAVAISAQQEGHVVQCPDCHSEFTATAKRAPAPRTSKTLSSAEAPEEFVLSEPVATPRYIPARGEGVDAQELYGDEAASPTPAARLPKGTATRPAQFAVVCPLCQSRMYATQDQIGTMIRCGDCHSEFSVVAPRELPRTTHVVQPDATDDEFRLSEPPPRPKYQPLTRGEVSRAELDELADPPAALENTPRPPAARPAFDFEVVCRHCGSRIPVREQQVGQTLRCGDCHSPLTVTRPRQRRRVAHAAPPTPEEQDALPTVAATAAEAARTSQGESAIRWLREAEAEVEEEAQEVPPPSLDKFSYPHQLFGFLFQLGTVMRIAGLSIGLSALFLMGGLAVDLADKGPAAMLVIILIVFQVCVLVPMAMFWANCGLSIVAETSDGSAAIDEWAEDSFFDWFVQAIYVGMAFVVSGVPAAVLTGVLAMFSDSPWISVVSLAISSTLFFPLVLLSMLETGHLLQVYSPAIWGSVPSVPWPWIRLYATSVVLGGGVVGAFLLAATGVVVLALLAAVLTIALSFVYFRAVGIAAFWAAGESGAARAAPEASADAPE